MRLPYIAARSGFLTVGAMLLAACVSAPKEGPPVLPTPFPEIVTTPELEAWTTAQILTFRATKEDEAFGFGLQTMGLPAALDSTENGEMTLLVTAAEPPEDWFATPLGPDPVVIIIHPDNPIQDLSTDQARDIFSGRSENWQDHSGPDLVIQPVIPLEDAETRSFLQRHLLEDQRFASTALIGPTPIAVIELVQTNIGGIGMLPLSAVDNGGSLLTIDGYDPEQDDRYPWNLELLGTSPSEPTGEIREWLAWLQTP